MNAYDLGNLWCPACKESLSQAVAERNDLNRGPKDGDNTVCAHCLKFLVYFTNDEGELALRAMDQEEFEGLREQHQAALMQARANVQGGAARHMTAPPSEGIEDLVPEVYKKYNSALVDVGANMAGSTVAAVISSMLMVQGMTPEEIGETFETLAEHTLGIIQSSEMASMIGAGDQVMSKTFEIMNQSPGEILPFPGQEGEEDGSEPGS